MRRESAASPNRGHLLWADNDLLLLWLFFLIDQNISRRSVPKVIVRSHWMTPFLNCSRSLLCLKVIAYFKSALIAIYPNLFMIFCIVLFSIYYNPISCSIFHSLYVINVTNCDTSFVIILLKPFL